MDSCTQEYSVSNVVIAIFGSGREGTAMSLEMPTVPVIKRGEDFACDVALICWPAHAIKEFDRTHPLAAKATKISFCNGPWGERDGADHAGICYVHAVDLGTKTKPSKKSWRVGRKDLAAVLTQAGLGVVCSNADHYKHIWGKSLFLIPIVLACADTGLSTKQAIGSVEHAEWYDVVRQAAVADIGEKSVASSEPRVKFLLERSPARQLLSWLPDEISYFRKCLTEA